MKTSRFNGGYLVTGYTKSGNLVQYTVEKNGHCWTADLVHGEGADLYRLYPTKAAAVAAIENQG